MARRYLELLDAIAFAAEKHRDERRKDAQATPYINHPLQVADALAFEGGVSDLKTLMAAVLHDTVEDTDTTFEELAERFGTKVAGIVKEVTDEKLLSKVQRKREQNRARAAAEQTRSARQARRQDLQPAGHRQSSARRLARRT